MDCSKIPICVHNLIGAMWVWIGQWKLWLFCVPGPGIKKKLTRFFRKYSCNKVTKTWIQISRQNWLGVFSNYSHQMIIQLKFLDQKASGIDTKSFRSLLLIYNYRQFKFDKQCSDAHFVPAYSITTINCYNLTRFVCIKAM